MQIRSAAATGPLLLLTTTIIILHHLQILIPRHSVVAFSSSTAYYRYYRSFLSTATTTTTTTNTVKHTRISTSTAVVIVGMSNQHASSGDSIGGSPSHEEAVVSVSDNMKPILMDAILLDDNILLLEDSLRHLERFLENNNCSKISDDGGDDDGGDDSTTMITTPSSQDEYRYHRQQLRSKLALYVVQASNVLLNVAATGSKKTTRRELMDASKQLLLLNDDRAVTMVGQQCHNDESEIVIRENSNIIPTTSTSSGWMIAACVGVALALYDSSSHRKPLSSEDDVGPLQPLVRAATSALSSTMEASRHELNIPANDPLLLPAKNTIQTLVMYGATNETSISRKIILAVDWHIIASLARALGMSANQNSGLSKAVSIIVHQTLDEATDSNSKTHVASALALASAFQPWADLSPIPLVETAITFDLWHAAKKICVSAAASSSNGEAAVHALIDAALEARLYRQSDTFATELYEMGGRSRYLVTRFQHACSTIAKVVRKRALPVIDRQVDRVDKAVDKVVNDPVLGSITTSSDDTDDLSLINTAKEEIRNFSLRQLEESGDVDMAHRLAGIWGIEYVYNEEAVLAAVEARRQKYLQWQDLLPGSPPDLLATPGDLLEAFASLGELSGMVLGFDCEWSEDDVGPDLIQLATTKTILLVDIPALSMTVDGADALEQTVGRLFASPFCVKVGFACRQDLSKLRSSPCIRKADDHWFGKTTCVVDLQVLIWEKNPALGKLGLSRASQQYLGKPLDKAEQCSLWRSRPLSLQQRVYAALDAWACVAIFSKLS